MANVSLLPHGPPTRAAGADGPPRAGTLLDVVMVPDFRARAAVSFEARTLFFLASWLERAGRRARGSCHLHLACIGEPPGSVRRMAARCGAGISVHEPLLVDDTGTANKLRGLETVPHSPRLLLIDADLLVLNDLGNLAEAMPADVFAASAACCRRVPEAYWQTIYDALGVPPPAERILGVRAQWWGRPGAEPMSPYYNSGVLLLPRETDLRASWEQDITRIRSLFARQAATGGLTPALHACIDSDQAGLATALHRLRLAGRPFRPLPETWNFRPSHFVGGVGRFGEVQLFHAIHFLRGVQSREEIEPAMEAYIQRWTGEIRAGRRRRGEGWIPWRGWMDARRAAGLLRGLWRRHVRPALAGER